jgi:transcriptional/translational regulatory protein YebC/TACO1
MDAGGDDLQTVDDYYEITTSVESFESVRKAIEISGLKVQSAQLTRIPQNTVNVEEKNCKSLLRLMDMLEDHDDIQKLYSNFDITDELMTIMEESS